ncbi:UNVERIFIED_CONTAM: hypothetical protein GTU68_003776 [Idotea baltica]|nr:hypothetical protein [Idotea baltica]
MLGLQVSENHQDMIENMVRNFAYLIESVGFIPNGNRTYYLGRSQPPFFSVMVQLLSEIKGKEALTAFLPAMEKEYNFWMEGKDQVDAQNRGHRRVVFLSKGIVMNRYWDDKAEPRPESYKEDVELAESTDRPKEELYRNLRAACESGWDFSTRWFRDGESLRTIRTTELVPVDLNSLMYHLEMTLSEAHSLQGNTEKSEFYLTQAKFRQKGILKYCWDGKNEWFCDFDFVLRQPTEVPTLAMMAPLFFNLAGESQSNKVATHIESQFLHSGGVSTTLFKSGQQWDRPNGWAPLQWMTIKGLRNYQHKKLADELAKRWVEINTRVYKTTGKLTEKYNVVDMELEAGGGEYNNQDGFGWTNGVLARLLSEEPVL